VSTGNWSILSALQLSLLSVALTVRVFGRMNSAKDFDVIIFYMMLNRTINQEA